MLGSGQPRTPVNAHGPRRTVCHGPSEEGLRRSFFFIIARVTFKEKSTIAQAELTWAMAFVGFKRSWNS